MFDRLYNNTNLGAQLNFREISRLNPNYYEINREERNYAAILFTALCNPNNSIAFLKSCGYNIKSLGEDYGIYFEYSFLRDLWFQLKDNALKKEIIRKLLKIRDIDKILDNSFFEINNIFGSTGKSREYIESPSNWAISKYTKNFNNEDFLKVCLFKWSFNIKPDIVIHLNKNSALCIEAKYESGEGKYPGSKKDQTVFEQRGLLPITQTTLQKYMMEELLGIETKFLFLVSKKSKSETHKTIKWREAFEILDTSELPVFAQEMIKIISKDVV